MSAPSPDDKNTDAIFQDAVEALRRGEKVRARELLTLLLKADQNNASYWVWLSASVDNTRERIYCLQTAFKLDPQNTAAKRGLILLGALPPDPNTQPFPMNRPRVWEEKLLLASEKPREKGWRVVANSPVLRLAGILLVGAGIVSALIFGFVLPRRYAAPPTQTLGPSPTFTSTPTLIGAPAEPTRIFSGATPLWMMLPQTYTPTPLYVNTPRALDSRDQFRIAMDSYEKGDWDTFITNMQLIIPLEPQSADVPYLIGEAYRFKNESGNAIRAYNTALDINPDFAPAYLGLARAQLSSKADFDAAELLDLAIELDPNYGEAYLERARFLILSEDPQGALDDLDRANQLLPESPSVYLAYADAYLALDDMDRALESVEKAYSLDITMLPVYELLGRLYIEGGQYQKAVEALELFATFEKDDPLALAMLGRAYYEQQDYQSAVEKFDRAFDLNRSGLRSYYFFRGAANLELGDVDQAVEDLETALEDDKTSFEVNLALARGYYIQEKFGSAFIKVEVLKSVADTDEETALMLYWRALVQEKRGEAKDAKEAWQDLLAMDESVMTPEIRVEALDHLKVMVTPTNTPKAGAKPTATPTP